MAQTPPYGITTSTTATARQQRKLHYEQQGRCEMKSQASSRNRCIQVVLLVLLLPLGCATTESGRSPDVRMDPDEIPAEDRRETECSGSESDPDGAFVPENQLSASTGYECAWGAEYLTNEGSLGRLGQLFKYQLYSNVSWQDDRLAGRFIFFNSKPFETVTYGQSIGEYDSDQIDVQLDVIRDSLLRAVKGGEIVRWDDYSYIGAAALAEALLIVDEAVDISSGVVWVASIRIIKVFIDVDANNGVIETRLAVLPDYHGDKVLLMELEAGKELLKATKALYEQAE